MTPIASRLKDALWSVRRRFGLKADIDRIFPFIVFERDLNETQLNDLFIAYSKRVPEDFNSALLARIQQVIRVYWQYRRVHKGYHKVLKSVIFLENVARYGYEGCQLVRKKIIGYELQLKPRPQK